MPVTSCPPCKEWAFNVSVPSGASIDSVIDSVVEFVGIDDVDTVQHLGLSRFQVVVKSASASRRVVQQGFMKVGSEQVPIEPIGPVFTVVVCRYLPAYVSSEHLIRALQPYGKVLDVEHVMYKDRPTIKTGDRAVKIDMKEDNPVPNFLRVNGHRVTFSYKGMKRVCRRCRQEGHYKDSCTTPYCERCLSFGHVTTSCSVPCRRCGGSHATVDCTVRKSYSEAASRSLEDYPALPSKSQEEAKHVVAGDVEMTPETGHDVTASATTDVESGPLVIVEDDGSTPPHPDGTSEDSQGSSPSSPSALQAVHPLPQRLAAQAPARDGASKRPPEAQPTVSAKEEPVSPLPQRLASSVPSPHAHKVTTEGQSVTVVDIDAKRQLSTSSNTATDDSSQPIPKRKKVISSPDLMDDYDTGTASE